MAGRKNAQRERRLLSEYLAIARPKQRVIFNARLGPVALQSPGALPVGIPPQVFSNSQMYSDAVVVGDGYVEIWEAKGVMDGRAIGQLLEYELALRQSPDFVEFRNEPAKLEIVCAVARPTAVALAKQLNIEVHFYAPAWIVQDFASWYTNLQQPILAASATVHP